MNGRAGLLVLKSVQRIKLFGDTKREMLGANLWEVFEALDYEVLENDYNENLRKNFKNKSQ